MNGGFYTSINSKAQHPLGIPQAFKLTPIQTPISPRQNDPLAFRRKSKVNILHSLLLAFATLSGGCSM